jgi:hypothetical protein
LKSGELKKEGREQEKLAAIMKFSKEMAKNSWKECP